MTEKKAEFVHENDSSESTYRAPRILFREPFETIATACLPVGIAKESAATCADGPINS